MSDLVSGVLTRISELEAEYREFAADLGLAPEEFDATAAGMRLCRAHRQIVDEHAPRHVASFAVGLGVVEEDQK